MVFRYSLMLVLVVFAGVIGYGLPLQGISAEGQRCLGLFFLCVGLWISHVIPLHVTSLLVMVILPIVGIMDSRRAFALFGNEAMFFILGAFILSSILIECGLSVRITLWVLSTFGRNPRALRASVFLLCGFLSFWMSEHAVAVMAFPIILEMVHAQRLEPMKSRYAASLFLSMSYGCIIGGIATFLGGARAPLALGILLENTGIRIGFFEWLLADLPLVLCLLGAGLLVVDRYFGSDISDIKRSLVLLKRKVESLGPTSKREYAIGTVMILTILSWIFLRNYISLASAALMAVSLLFVFNLVRWREVEHGVDWSIILMYGGAIALGSAVSETGAATWLLQNLIGDANITSFFVIAVAVGVSIFLTECISNTAVVAVLLPVALNLARGMQIDPVAMTFVITLPAGLAFMMPMATPALAVSFSSGFLKRADMIKVGFVMNLIAWALFLLTARYYWPLIGYKLFS